MFEKLKDEEMINRALSRVGQVLVNKALSEPPKPRVRTGFLRGSWFIDVDGKIKDKGKYTAGGTSVSVESGASVSERWADVQGESRKKQVVVGFNTPYATVQHELENVDYSPGEGAGRKAQREASNRARWNADSGPFFLSAKLKKHGNLLSKVFADSIRGEL